MITRRVAFLLALSLVVATVTPVQAGGGGGTKRSSTIRFVNESTTEVGVTSNANSSAIQAALAAMNLTNFQAAGGKVLNAGATGSFYVQAGTYEVGAADVSGTLNPIVPITESVTVAQGFAGATGLRFHGGDAKVIFVERFADHKYYNMHQAAARALMLFQKEIMGA